MLNSIEVGRPCLGFNRLTNLSAATSCPKAHGAAVQFQPETQSIRYTVDGTEPTTTIGFLVTAGTTVFYVGDLTKVQFTEVTSGATLNVHVFG